MKEENWRTLLKKKYTKAYKGVVPSERIESSIGRIMEFIENTVLPQEISKAKQETWDKAIAKIKGNIGMLRQWINEDRITDPEKMVANEQIEMMLMMGIEYPKQAKEKDI